MNCYPTGFASLDVHLGTQGLFGLVEVYGEENTGKSVLAAQLADYTGGLVGIVACDNKNDPRYLSRLIGNCAYAVPYSGEAAIEAAYALLPVCSAVIIDSTTGLVPLAEEELLVGDRIPNAQNRLLYHGLSTLRVHALKYGCLVLVVSEIRVNIQRRRLQSSCENITKELADFRILMHTKTTTTDLGAMDKKVVEARLRSRSTELGSGKLTLLPRAGFSRGLDKIEALLLTGRVKRKGGYYFLDGARLGMGKAGAARAIEKKYANRLHELV